MDLFRVGALAASAIGFVSGAVGIRHELMGARRLGMAHVLVSGITALNLGILAYLLVVRRW